MAAADKKPDWMEMATEDLATDRVAIRIEYQVCMHKDLPREELISLKIFPIQYCIPTDFAIEIWMDAKLIPLCTVVLVWRL